VAVNIIVDVIVIAVVRSEVVAVAAGLVAVSYLKLYCPLPCLLLYCWL